MDSNTVFKGITAAAAAAANGKKQFIAKLKNKFMKSPLASNVVLGLILTALEKTEEMQFACPCDPTWNALFASAFFVLPGFTASVLMLVVQGCKCKFRQERENLLLFALVPVIMWLVLVFLDGQYYVCAKTNWTGSFVTVDKADPQKWCEPDNSTSNVTNLKRSHEWYVQSQAIGFGIILVCTILLIIYGAHECLRKRNTDGKSQDEERTDADDGVELRATDPQPCPENVTLRNTDSTILL